MKPMCRILFALTCSAAFSAPLFALQAQNRNSLSQNPQAQDSQARNPVASPFHESASASDSQSPDSCAEAVPPPEGSASAAPSCGSSCINGDGVGMESGDEGEAEPEDASLEGDFRALMKEMRKVSPVAYEKLQARPREDALKILFRAMDVELSTPHEESSSEAHREKPSAFVPSVKSLAGGRALYLRLDDLSESALKRLSGDVAFRNSKDKFGLVVDLRSCESGNRSLLPDFAKLFSGVGRGLCILTSSRTRGPAELLPVMLRGKAAWIGSPSSGNAFPLVPAEAAGRTWLLPRAEESEADFFPLKGAPDFKKEPFPQTAFDSEPLDGDPSSDPCLAFATDLLIAKALLTPRSNP